MSSRGYTARLRKRGREREGVGEREGERERERERYVKTLAYVFIRNSIRKFRQKEWEKIRFKVCT